MSYELLTATDYIHEKNVFLVHVDMSQYLLEYYVYRKNYVGIVTAEQDAQLKDLIACFAIHLTAGIGSETHAWTLTLVSESPYSLFVTGSTGEVKDSKTMSGFLVGNILTEHIRHSDSNGIHAQVTGRGKTANSYVSCEAESIVGMVEAFYQQSEQRPIRIKISSNSDTAIGMVALPGYEPEWFAEVDLDAFVAASEHMNKSRMRDCRFSFICNCSAEKLLPFFRAMNSETLTDLYRGDAELLINCPRCGKNFVIKREDLLEN